MVENSSTCSVNALVINLALETGFINHIHYSEHIIGFCNKLIYGFKPLRTHGCTVLKSYPIQNIRA